VTVGDGATGEVLPHVAVATAAATTNTAITQVRRIDVDVLAMDSPLQEAHGKERKRSTGWRDLVYFEIFFMYASSLSFS
jgi:hypothetical protein